MDTNGNMKTSPANTSLTGHDNNNEQAHINQTNEIQTQNETNERENKDTLITYGESWTHRHEIYGRYFSVNDFIKC